MPRKKKSTAKGGRTTKNSTHQTSRLGHTHCTISNRKRARSNTPGTPSPSPTAARYQRNNHNRNRNRNSDNIRTYDETNYVEKLHLEKTIRAFNIKWPNNAWAGLSYVIDMQDYYGDHERTHPTKMITKKIRLSMPFEIKRRFRAFLGARTPNQNEIEAFVHQCKPPPLSLEPMYERIKAARFRDGENPISLLHIFHVAFSRYSDCIDIVNTGIADQRDWLEDMTDKDRYRILSDLYVTNNLSSHPVNKRVKAILVEREVPITNLHTLQLAIEGILPRLQPRLISHTGTYRFKDYDTTPPFDLFGVNRRSATNAMAMEAVDSAQMIPIISP